MIAGIDSVHLTTKDYRVHDVTRLKELGWGGKANALDETRVLVQDDKGGQIRANSLYNNSKNRIGHYDISPYGLLIHFNPSKVYHDYHLISTGNQFDLVVKSIQKEAKEIGIDVSTGEMHLTRLDLTKQAMMRYEVPQYASAFRLLHGKRAQKKEYPSGYQFSNTQRQFVFYDKAQEIQDKKGTIDEINFMRAEAKFLKKDSVKSATKIISLSDLKQTSNDQINSFYSRQLTENVFCRKNIGMQSVLDFNNEVQILQQLMAVNKRGAWKQYLLLRNIDDTINELGGIERFVQLCVEAGYSRSKKFDIQKELKQIIHTKSFIDNRRKVISASSLLDEVFQKFA